MSNDPIITSLLALPFFSSRIWDWLINKKSKLKVFEMRGQKRKLKPDSWKDDEEEQKQRIIVDRA